MLIALLSNLHVEGRTDLWSSFVNDVDSIGNNTQEAGQSSSQAELLAAVQSMGLEFQSSLDAISNRVEQLTEIVHQRSREASMQAHRLATKAETSGRVMKRAS